MIAKTLSKWKINTSISERVETIDTPQEYEVILSWIPKKQTKKTIGSLRVNQRFLKDPRSSPYFTRLLQDAAEVALNLSTTYEIIIMGESGGRLGISFLGIPQRKRHPRTRPSESDADPAAKD